MSYMLEYVQEIITFFMMLPMISMHIYSQQWGFQDLLVTARFFNDRHAGDAGPVIPVMLAQVVEEAPVDVVDDLHVPRQQLLHQPHRPLLQGLWQHCVVGEGKHLQVNVSPPINASDSLLR